MNGVKVLLNGNNFTLQNILICTLDLVCMSNLIVVKYITFFQLIPKDLQNQNNEILVLVQQVLK